MRTGFIGGLFGDCLLRWISGRPDDTDGAHGGAYQHRSKLESLFGPRIWQELSDRVVIDFGCGFGAEVIEIAQHGANRAIGVDIRPHILDVARREAERQRLSHRCHFTTRTEEQGDVIVSLDGFEHFDDPATVLQTMRQLVREEGKILIAFGPTWFHPLGGHLFSVFPWAHLLFTEEALIRWRSRFKSDGATRFGEVEGGLNQMTIGRFERLLAESDFEVRSFEAVPIRRVHALSRYLPREFFTSIVRCELRPKKVAEQTPAEDGRASGRGRH